MAQKEEIGIEKEYGNRIRVRVMGLLVEDNQILLVKHKKLRPTGNLWIPPGGGLEKGESLEEALQREFKEEVNLEIQVYNFLFADEFRSSKLHALELFYKVKRKSGHIKIGADPEMGTGHQIISEVKLWRYEDIKRENPLEFHQIFQESNSIADLIALRGLFRYFENS